MPGSYVLGVAGVSAGIVLAVCRFVFLPLELSDGVNAVLVGGAMGLLVTGISLFRGARSAGAPLRAPALAAAAVVPLAVVVGTFLVLAPGDGGDDVTLVPRELPGVRIALPDWPVGRDSGPTLPGVLALDDPRGRGRFVTVRWSPGQSLDVDAMRRMVRSVLDVEGGEEIPVTVAGQPTQILYTDDGEGRTSAVTLWRCPESNLSLMLWTFRDTGREPLLALHRRMLASVTCTAPPAAPVVRFPAFTPPEGYTPVDTTGADAPMRAWAGPNDTALFLWPGTPAGDAEKARAMTRQPFFRRELLAALELRDIEFAPAPLERPGPDGRPREIWSGTARDTADGTASSFLLVAWHCPDPGLLFIALHLGPAGEPDPAVVAALAGGACP